MAETLKQRVFAVIDSPDPEDWRGKWFDDFMIVLIVTNVIAVVLETVDAIASAFPNFFYYFELFSVIVFSVEYVLRIWTADQSDDERFQAPVMGRIRFAFTPLAIIDALAILPFYLTFFFAVDLRFMRVFRLLRLLKLTRYSPALHTLAAAAHTQRRALGAALVIIMTLLIFASSVIYLLEREAQPDVFSSIPASMWWGLATLTTVGYGDVTPVSVAGKVFGSFIMILGIGMFALPAGILATAFANEIRKREFVVTWSMVAAVPLFSRLDALTIMEIVNLLEIRVVPPRYKLFDKGDPADAMYFISVGKAEVDIPPEPVRLENGDFFGEIALLKDSPRTAAVSSITECQLLVLSVDAFERLLQTTPHLRDTLTQVMEERLSQLESNEWTPEAD